MTLFTVITQSAEAALELQHANGSMPPGHNGPYHDPETPVRNTSHWLITFLKAHQLTGEVRYRQAAAQAAAYLTRDAARPQGKTFYHRTNPKKDAANGLIGQAWTIEALVAASQGLERPDLLQVAEDVFLLHPFDEQTALWDRVEIDGRTIGVDPTFNHQLWFAAAGALLANQGSNPVNAQVLHFLDHIDMHVALYPSGLIRHRHPRTLEHPNANEARWHDRSIGYHTFNLYALALLEPLYPSHPFWQRDLFRSLWAYAQSDEYRDAVAENTYGYSYNPVGIEMAFALEHFAKNAQDKQCWWLSEQCRRSLDIETGLMTRGTEDAATHAARLYEATRLPNLHVDL